MTFLKNKTISLRGLEREDLKYLYQLENDISIQEYGSSLMPQTSYVLKSFINNAGKDIFETKQLRLVIEHNETCKAVGAIDIFNFDPHHQRAEVGIIINLDEQQKGYASEALESLCEYAFNTLFVNQLYCYISNDNISSQKLFRKLKFTPCGELKQWLRKKDSFEDVTILQRLNEMN